MKKLLTGKLFKNFMWFTSLALISIWGILFAVDMNVDANFDNFTTTIYMFAFALGTAVVGFVGDVWIGAYIANKLSAHKIALNMAKEKLTYIKDASRREELTADIKYHEERIAHYEANM